MNTAYHTLFIILFLTLGSADHALAQAKQSQQDATNNCNHQAVDFAYNSNLTRQENIQRMDAAFQRSLNHFDDCQQNLSTPQSNSANPESNNSDNQQSISSSASTTMSGTESKQQQDTTSQQKTEPSSELFDETQPSFSQNKTTKPSRQHSQGGGKVPDDIPAVDNDSILEAQIRQAAIAETDPAIKTKLWNEYRKYKGLPVQSH